MSIAFTPNPPTEPLQELVWGDPYVSAIPAGGVVNKFGFFAPGYSLSEGRMAAIKAGHAAIWAYGEIRYTDTFKKAHVTKFKFAFEGDVITDPPGGMYSAADGNEAD